MGDNPKFTTQTRAVMDASPVTTLCELANAHPLLFGGWLENALTKAGISRREFGREMTNNRNAKFPDQRAVGMFFDGELPWFDVRIHVVLKCLERKCESVVEGFQALINQTVRQAQAAKGQPKRLPPPRLQPKKAVAKAPAVTLAPVMPPAPAEDADVAEETLAADATKAGEETTLAEDTVDTVPDDVIPPAPAEDADGVEETPAPDADPVEGREPLTEAATDVASPADHADNVTPEPGEEDVAMDSEAVDTETGARIAAGDGGLLAGLAAGLEAEQAEAPTRSEADAVAAAHDEMEEDAKNKAVMVVLISMSRRQNRNAFVTAVGALLSQVPITKTDFKKYLIDQGVLSQGYQLGPMKDIPWTPEQLTQTAAFLKMELAEFRDQMVAVLANLPTGESKPVAAKAKKQKAVKAAAAKVETPAVEVAPPKVCINDGMREGLRQIITEASESLSPETELAMLKDALDLFEVSLQDRMRNLLLTLVDESKALEEWPQRRLLAKLILIYSGEILTPAK